VGVGVDIAAADFPVGGVGDVRVPLGEPGIVVDGPVDVRPPDVGVRGSDDLLPDRAWEGAADREVGVGARRFWASMTAKYWRS
jgi:hypothetical protein